MARMAKMATCPTCGVTIAENLAKRIRQNEEGYKCPGTTTESRKDFEKKWAEDLESTNA